MNYFTVYDGAGYDESFFYPLFHCLPIKNFINSEKMAKLVAKNHEGAIVIEKYWDRPKWYRNVTTKTHFHYDGKTWRKK